MADDRVKRIKEANDIVDVVGGYVSLRPAGPTYKGLCPFHKEKSPSFVVYPQEGRCHCFGCGVSADIFRFYMLINKVEFPDALRVLAARTGVELDPEAARRKAGEAHDKSVVYGDQTPQVARKSRAH